MIAAISDTHGVLHALQAVLGEIESAQAIPCCGDIAGYGPIRSWVVTWPPLGGRGGRHQP